MNDSLSKDSSSVGYGEEEDSDTVYVGGGNRDTFRRLDAKIWGLGRLDAKNMQFVRQIYLRFVRRDLHTPQGNMEPMNEKQIEQEKNNGITTDNTSFLKQERCLALPLINIINLKKNYDMIFVIYNEAPMTKETYRNKIIHLRALAKNLRNP